MEFEPDDLPEHNIPLGREVYLSAEQIALRGIVDELFRRVDKPWETTESEER